MKHIVNFSGGIGSWAAAKRVVAKYGTQDVVLLFADTMMEDEDTYRFLYEAAANVGVPLTRIADGRTPWQVFFDERFLGNSRVDPCSKILKRELLDKWRADNCNPEISIVYLGIDWSEIHRLHDLQAYPSEWKFEGPMCEEPFLDKEEMIAMAEAQGIKRQKLYSLGFPHANCFSGETRFLTSDGCRSLAEMSGKTCKVLGSNGKWRIAEVRSFGIQPLLRVTLKRMNQRKVIHSTAGHRWITWMGARSTNRKELTTDELLPNTRLVSMFGNGMASSISLSVFGVAHGIVFGDGDRNDVDKAGFTNPARLTLCGEKDAQLLQYFPLSPRSDIPGTGIQVRDLPRYFKDRPRLDESKSYLAGWLAGYIAADGSVKKDGEVVLSSAKLDDLLFVRDVCVRLGIGTLQPRSAMRSGFGAAPTALYTLPFIRSTMREDLFLIAEHRSRFIAHDIGRKKISTTWMVESVAPSNRTEEVFCAVVPEGRAFTLEDNIFVGNCGGFCIKAGHAHFINLLKTMPDRYAFHEGKEQELRAYLKRDDIGILRDRRGGQSRAMTLKELREREEAKDCNLDREDWGGCGCALPAGSES